MNLGNKIKVLRLKAGMTQEMLANAFGVSYQTISKWENNVCAPDIEMLPRISIYFGISIDELFDLSAEERIRRIENMLDFEQELPNKTFEENVEFLQQQLDTAEDKSKFYNLLAQVYHHRMMSDSAKVSNYVRKALQINPLLDNCQWLLQKAEGAVARDWNVKNHSGVIDFYKELVKKNPEISNYYLELMDNLLADNRTKEAEEYLAKYSALNKEENYRSLYYQWKIADIQNNQDIMQQVMEKLEENYADNGTAMFLLANMHAEKADFDKALTYFDKSFELDVAQKKKPLYTDALEAMALIYQMKGQNEKAITCYDRMLEVLEHSFGCTEGAPVDEVIEKRNKLYTQKSN